MPKITKAAERRVLCALDTFCIELPSWGFANTGTRFGKFRQDAAAVTLEEKLHDAGLVHALTGACPTVAVHVLWDFDDPADPASARRTKRLAKQHGVQIGSINPNLFQDQQYKLGSFCSPFAAARARSRPITSSVPPISSRLAIASATCDASNTGGLAPIAVLNASSRMTTKVSVANTQTVGRSAVATASVRGTTRHDG